MAQTEEVDRQHQRAVIRARWHPGDVEQAVDRPLDLGDGSVDGAQVRHVQRDVAVSRWAVGKVQRCHPRALGLQLGKHGSADPRGAPGHNGVLPLKTSGHGLSPACWVGDRNL